MIIFKNIPFVRFTRWVIHLILLGSALASCGGSIPAPVSNPSSPATVTLQGQLTDAASGEPIVAARIDIGKLSAITDSKGHYEMANVPANNSTNNGVTRDYLATVTLTSVTAPIDMTNTATTPRYPDRKFTAPLTPASSSSAAHDFKVGKLSASIQGVTGDSNRVVLGSVVIELQDNTPATAGTVLRSTTSDAVTGQYSFANIEAGVDYLLVAHSADWSLQGNISTGKLSENQVDLLPLSGTTALVLSNIDTYAPRVITATPVNNSDVTPGAVNVVLTFNEAIKQGAYSIPNASVLNNIYNDINVSYGGQKASGNYAHTMSWNSTFDALTIAIPNTGVSAKFTVDLSLAMGKLKDLAGNGMSNSPVLTTGNLLSFSTNGGVLAVAPVIVSTNAPGLNSNATSVSLDWLPVTGATKGYNVYRSARNKLSTGTEPFVLIAGAVTTTTYADTFAATGFNLLPTSDTAQYYVYRATSINSDLLESSVSNEVIVKDVIAPAPVGTSGTCVPPGGNSLTVITTPATASANGQVKYTFSEALDKITAETLANYTGVNVSAVKLTSSTTVVLDFSAPVTCANTNNVVIGTGVTDVAGNAMSGNLALRTLTYVP